MSAALQPPDSKASLRESLVRTCEAAIRCFASDEVQGQPWTRTYVGAGWGGSRGRERPRGMRERVSASLADLLSVAVGLGADAPVSGADIEKAMSLSGPLAVIEAVRLAIMLRDWAQALDKPAPQHAMKTKPYDKDLLRLRAKNLSWKDIGKELGMTPRKARNRHGYLIKHPSAEND